jgi:hypothetical protein
MGSASDPYGTSSRYSAFCPLRMEKSHSPMLA